MAEFTADLNPKNTNQMTLGDMMKVGLYSAETAIAQRQAQMAEQKTKEMPIIQQWAKDPANKLPDGSFDLEQVPALISVAPMSGPEYADKIISLTKNHIETNKALNELSESNRKPFASVYGSYGQMAANGQKVNPTDIINSLETLKQYYPQLTKAADVQIKGWKAYPSDHPVDPQSLLRARNESLTPTQLIDQFAPKAETATIGGAQRPVVRQPSMTGEQPTITPTQFGGGANAVGGGGTTELPKPSAKDRDLIKYDKYLDYKENPALADYTDEQRENLKEGKLLLKESNAIASAAKEQEANTRGVIENISAASGNRPGQLLRQGGKYIIGNATQEMLNKNIARMAAASEVMGTAKTDQSRADAKVINGSDDLTAQALTDIVSRADATVKAATMFNSAYNKLIEKRGVNGYIQAEKLKSAWVDNYDVRMAQIDALAASNSPEAKSKANEIYASIPKDQREEFNRKWSNLHALEQGKFR